jgi:murein DD-endopeptidase MepM/ murein hydrolase activator NlpD
MANDPVNPIIQELLNLIEPQSIHTPPNPATHAPAVNYDGPQTRPTSAFAATDRPAKSSNPHGGIDQNRGRGEEGPVTSPISGVIGDVGGPYGHIVIHETDPVTGALTGYDVEILHTQTRFPHPGDPVQSGDPIGIQGGVGAASDMRIPRSSMAPIQRR